MSANKIIKLLEGQPWLILCTCTSILIMYLYKYTIKSNKLE